MFKQRPVRPAELTLVMRIHIITGCMGAVWGNLITGIVYVYFGNAIGMNQFQWGILASVTLWVIVAQPLGAVLGERYGSRKRVWFIFAVTDRSLRFLGVIGAFLLWRAGNGWAFLVLVTAVGLGSLAGNLAVAPWFGWLATIIPQDRQGAFWGRRDAWVSLCVILVVVPAGLLMDLVAPAAKTAVSVAILSAGGLIGFADLLFHSTIPEPPVLPSAVRGSMTGILAALRDKGFRPWLVFMACWNFSWYLGGGLCTLYFMENLGFKHNLLGGTIAATAIGLLGSVLTARIGGHLVDRWGVLRVISFSYVCWSVLPFIWLLATPSTAILWVGLAGLVGGIFPLAANNAAVKLVTRFPSAGESAMYMGVSNGIANIAAGLGSFVAGTFLHAVGDWSFLLLGLTVSAFPVLFIASGVLRLLSAVLLIPRIRERGELPAAGRKLLLPLFFGPPPGRATAPPPGRATAPPPGRGEQ